jgi:signal peptidase II
MKNKLRLIAISVLLLTTVGCDQVTKGVARLYLSSDVPLIYLKGVVKFILAHNTGGFLSWGSQWPEAIRFIIFSVLVTVAIFACLLYICFSNRISTQMVIAYSLMIASGAGNLIDRLVFSGKVTDFIHISIGPFQTGIFNIADVAGMVGAGLFLLQLFCGPNLPAARDGEKTCHP